MREAGGRIEALGRGTGRLMYVGFGVEERGLLWLIAELLNCPMGRRSKDFSLGRMLGWFLFCFELPDSH